MNIVVDRILRPNDRESFLVAEKEGRDLKHEEDLMCWCCLEGGGGHVDRTSREKPPGMEGNAWQIANKESGTPVLQPQEPAVSQQ